MTQPPVGSAGRMQIARGLIVLRERAQLTQVQLAERTGCSKATVSRYETWTDRRRVKWSMVKALADACGATAAERDALVEMARSQQTAGWWVGNPAVPQWLDPLVSFEAHASYELVSANSIVPGLLQTRDYARALQQGLTEAPDLADIDRELDARMQRQEILDRGLCLWVVLDESVLRRPVGDGELMAAQLEHLHMMLQRPNINIQVLPFRSARVARAGQYIILGHNDDQEPRNSMAVVYLELPQRGVYLDDPDDVRDYKTRFDQLRAEAAGAAETARLLTTAQEYLQ